MQTTAPATDRSASGRVTALDETTEKQMIDRAVAILLERQEGDTKSEWPYEGVYRVRGAIPIGYRVGGTAIVAMSLLDAPGYGADPARRDAVARAFAFIRTASDDPLMSPDYDGGYDVRGWGYTYALQFLLQLTRSKEVPAGNEDAAAELIRRNINAIQLTSLREVGGWNYARPAGKDAIGRSSPFMTGPTVQALIGAKGQGFAVDEGTLARALDALERARTPAGGVVYAGAAGERGRDAVPGAVGRMLVTESTLQMAGRGDPARIRGAIDAFFMHWGWLDQRRAKPGTHEGPYAIAPYYFYYAHRYAAQAIELLPASERAEYRRRLRDLIASLAQDDGTWNDRVFARSAAYGTAMCLSALCEMRSGR